MEASTQSKSSWKRQAVHGARHSRLVLLVLAAVLASVLGPASAQAATVRVTITWSTDSDIDLHVYDTVGNHAYYGDDTAIPSGQLSTDIIPDQGDNGPHSESYTDNADTTSLGFCAEYFSGYQPEPSTQVNYTITDPGGGTRSGNVVLAAPGSSAVIGSSPDGSVTTPTCSSGGPPPPDVESEEANLSVSVDDSRATVRPGQEFDYIINVLNKGPGVARNVAVNQSFSRQEVFVASQPSQGSCTFDDALHCQLGSLAANSQARVSVLVIPQYPKFHIKTPRLTRSWQVGPIPVYRTSKGSVSSGVSVSSSTPDPDGAGNTENETTVVRVPGASYAQPPPGRVKKAKGHGKRKHLVKRASRNNATASYVHSGSVPWSPTNDGNYWYAAGWYCRSANGESPGFTNVRTGSWWRTPKGSLYFTWKFRRQYRVQIGQGHEWSTSATVYHPFTETSTATARSSTVQGNGKVSWRSTSPLEHFTAYPGQVYRIAVQWKWWHHHTVIPDVPEKQTSWIPVVWCHS